MSIKSSNFAADLYTPMRKYVYTCAKYKKKYSQHEEQSMSQETLLKEGNETVTNCNQLKLPAADGKMRLTD